MLSYYYREENKNKTDGLSQLPLPNAINIVTVPGYIHQTLFVYQILLLKMPAS